jgi:hypothetical protein
MSIKPPPLSNSPLSPISPPMLCCYV